MKKFTLLLILNLAFLVFNVQKAKAQWVTIPDANFVTRLTQNYPQCMSGNPMDTTCSGIVNLTYLNVSYDSISNLTGIQYFDDLQYLNCSDNQLTNLDVSANAALVTLYCNSNQLTSLNLSGNAALTYLNCKYNVLTNLNLSSNTALTSIDCSNNILTSLDVSSNTILTYLKCSSNFLTSLNLPASDTLTYLDCWGNSLTSLNLSSNIGLTSLDCGVNQLTSLDVSNNLALTILRCRHIGLTSLDVSNNLALTNLDCGNNNLTNLDVSNNLALTALDCSHSQLSSLSQVPNVMSNFNIYVNNISCLYNLPQVSYSFNGNIAYNPLTCVPNQTNYSLGLPLCIEGDTANNPNFCQSVANILGNVYKDLNNNCTYNNTDLNTPNIPVKLYDNQNNFLAMSYTVNGVYSFASLQPDTFNVKINDVVLPLDMACGQANNQSVILNTANQTIGNINFPMVCDSSDIKVNSVTAQGWVFPGQVHRLKTILANDAYWYNLNCGNTTYSGTVTIQVSGPVAYVAPFTGALTPIVSGNNFTYTIADFNSLTPASFGLQLLIDTTAQAGQQICVHVMISPTSADADTTNNEYDFCYNVVNSYDPNMKEVYPTNVLPGYDDWFTYTIHFQNTGTAPAFNIRLRDTLDTQLDRSTFEFLGASHTANTSLNGNILTVRFNNIMLPDSTSDDEGSMGYYQYRVKPLPNITNGSTIENTAYIYFDYNPAIITNTTQNNFEMPVGNRVIAKNEAISIYPNPGTGIFTIKSASAIKTIEVFNLIGESVLQQTKGNTINISSQPQGIYFCKVNGSSVVKLVKE